MNGFFMPKLNAHAEGGWRARWYKIIFEHDTKIGWRFDMALLAIIVLSVFVAIIDSVPSVHRNYAELLYVLEWLFTAIFLIEYIARLLIVDKPLRYAKSALGLIDLLSILPAFISLLFPGSQYLQVVRLLRVLRVFRLLKLYSFMHEANVIVESLTRSSKKILVFMFSVMIIVTIFGSLMYVVEGPEHGFTSIPTAMYWGVVTMSTVGYGDVTPQTPLGQIISSLLMLIGYSVIAVPTGIYAAEMVQTMKNYLDRRQCHKCHLTGHLKDARYCRRCGEKFE